MKKEIIFVMVILSGVATAQQPGPSPSTSPSPVRPIGVVSQIKAGSLTLATDAGPELLVPLPEGISVVRVPPGAKDLKSATPITVGDISLGDRVLIRGRVSEDEKSVVATSVVVMAKTDLEKARETERAEWRQRGIGGVVKAVSLDTKEITIATPNTPPTPGNLTRAVIIELKANAALLRYAPDSVKFSEARPGTLEEVKVGDQVRALGARSEDGSRFAAEKLVSGTFRNLGATVISVDVPSNVLTVKDLATNQSVLVRTNADSQLHRLPPFLAQMIARYNSGEPLPGQSGGPGGGRRDGPTPGTTGGSPPAGGASRQRGSGPPNFQQMLDRTPPLVLGELKPGEALIVLSTEGAKPAEVTAITVLAGVEPILAAQPAGSEQMILGPWNMSMGEGGP